MSDPRKRVHTLLTDGAIAGLTAREREELESLLEGEPIDPSYEHAAAAIDLGLLGDVEALPSDVEATLIEQADRYFGFAELRPREPTLGGVELLIRSDADATPVRRVWERSPDNYEDFVLESSLTNGRLDRLGPGDSLRGEILAAAEDPFEPREAQREVEQASQFDSEVDAQLAALELEDRAEAEPPPEPVAARPRKRSRPESSPEPVAARPRERSQPEPATEQSESALIPIPPDYRVARWASYISAVAALAILVVALWLYGQRDDSRDPDELAAKIEASGDKLEWSFTAKPAPQVGSDAGGSILWSSELQAGLMILRGLAANDPTQVQYQLWIVDRGREGPPVDGGVFDVPAGSDELRVPVDAKLLVGDPALFQITVEQPGGVVVSSQKRVVMVAAAP